jgi:multidrug efflux pump subunit AcrA (membrane-fusion protein)
VVAYEVKVSFAGTPPAEAKAGMTANVDIVIDARRDINIIPARAVKKDSQGNSVVDVPVNNKTEPRPIQTGLSDGINTEISGGLNVGDIIILK